MPTFEEVKQQRYAEGLLPKGSRVLEGQKDLRVDLGCFRQKTPGHIGFDCAPGADPDYWCDLNEGIPLEDGCCASVIAAHFLEHVEDPEFMVYEMWRVCQPDAVVKINVPATTWEGVYALEHRNIIGEHFFRHDRAFWSLLRLTSMRYQIDGDAFDRLQRHLPELTLDEAGEFFHNVRRQLLVEAVPRGKVGSENLTINPNAGFVLGSTIGPPGWSPNTI